MTTRAKLFRTIDVIAALTGISIDQSPCSKVDELVNYVTGRPSMPKKGSRARNDTVATIRLQLPSGIDRFTVLDLIELIMQIQKDEQEDQLRVALVQNLERRYGLQMTLSPERDFESPCPSLLLLRSLANFTETTISPE